MSKSREEIVAQIQANKASLKFTQARMAIAIKAHDRTRLQRLESSERYTKIEMNRLAHILADMDSVTPGYSDQETAQGE